MKALLTTQKMLADIERMINVYHWKWGIVTGIINRRYEKYFTPKELRKYVQVWKVTSENKQ